MDNCKDMEVYQSNYKAYNSVRKQQDEDKYRRKKQATAVENTEGNILEHTQWDGNNPRA